MKTCKLCLIEKPLDDFYHVSQKRAAHGDGHDTRCKDCISKRGKALRPWVVHTPPKSRKELSKEYYWRHRDEKLAKQSLYRQTEGFKGAIERNREKYPEKRAAQIAVMNAVASGKLVRPSVCTACGVSCKPEAHHPDYSQPMLVIWACKKCHNAYHHAN